MEQNFSLTYQTSFENDSFLELQKYCTELMSKETEKTFKSPDFTSITITENPWSLLFNRQSSNEWNSSMGACGIAQNPELSSDPSSYSDDGFDALKNTLQQRALLNLLNLLLKIFWIDWVYPYKRLYPKNYIKVQLNIFWIVIIYVK